MFERFLVGGIALLYSQVIHTPPDSHIIGSTVLYQAFLFQIGFIHLHQLRIKGFKTQIFILSELDKAVHCRGITFCRPSPFLPLQFIDTSLHEVEHTLYRRDFPERSHDIINGVFHTGPLQIIDNTL